MAYELLIKGGHVLDPGQGIDKVLDIAISNGRIVALEDDIAAEDAVQTLEIRDDHRYVVPGLIDLHTHVAYGATTLGVGMGCCEPDHIGVHSGVTTVVDCGSVGVANMGVFPTHILPKSKTRIVCFVNIGSFAHTLPNPADLDSLDEVNEGAIASCIGHNPGLISGFKLRMVGRIVHEQGEELVRRSRAMAAEHGLPLMVHIGDMRAGDKPNPERFDELTRYLLRNMAPGDILTHLCTPNVGKVMDSGRPVPELVEARANGVFLDPTMGTGHFSYAYARDQAQLGISPDTISSDMTARNQTVQSLMECMTKFMAVGYSLNDVVRMTTTNAARAIGMENDLGAIAVGREADITILDVVNGDFRFFDSTGAPFACEQGIIPVQTVRAGELFSPHWGIHPWGWIPPSV